MAHTWCETVLLYHAHLFRLCLVIASTYRYSVHCHQQRLLITRRCPAAASHSTSDAHHMQHITAHHMQHITAQHMQHITSQHMQHIRCPTAAQGFTCQVGHMYLTRRSTGFKCELYDTRRWEPIIAGLGFLRRERARAAPLSESPGITARWYILWTDKVYAPHQGERISCYSALTVPMPLEEQAHRMLCRRA